MRGFGRLRYPVLRIAGFCLLLLTGCASTPVAPPHPYYATGPLQGRLEQGIYHDMRGWFGIASPISPSDPTYTYMSVGEEYHPTIGYVSFIPLDKPGEYYRAYMEDFPASGHVVPDMGQVADGAMRFFGKQLVQARVEPLHLVEERPWHAGATTGLLRLYTQRVPTEVLLGNLGMAEDYTAYILMYVTAEQGKVAMLWAEWPVGCSVCRPVPAGPATASSDPIDQALAADARSGAFLGSFRYGAD